MNCFYIFQLKFWCFIPNWFDWLSILVNIVSVAGGYFIATKIYSKEKLDKEIENESLMASEIKLFRNSLSQLTAAANDQIINLKQYLEKKDFSLRFNQGVNADFLHFIDVKYLYKDSGSEKKSEIARINNLLSNLYALNDFRASLRDEFRSYMKKFNFHEEKFYLYRKLLYTKYYEICNKRSVDVKIENGIKLWKLNPEDTFMKNYVQRVQETFQDNEIMSDRILINRQKLIEKFIIPLIHICADYIPDDNDAIEVADMANEVNAAYKDMEYTSEIHFKAVESHLAVLENVTAKSIDYLKSS